MSLIFVDVEAHFDSPCPGIGGGMTEFGAVEFGSKTWFHGRPWEWQLNSTPWRESRLNDNMWDGVFLEFERWLNGFGGRLIFMSDNPAYDWQWINYHFHHTVGRNPFGYSARRIGDFYAGLVGDFGRSSDWKRFRVTKHDHNPVHDAMGNVEAFERILKEGGGKDV